MKRDIIDRVYKGYYREVYLYMYALCKNHHQTESLVSDTFFKAMVSLEGNELHIKYWLFRVGKNLWLDSLKKKSQVPLDDVYDDKSLGPLDGLIASEKRRKLYKAIVALPNRYSEILIQYYYNDLSLKEIAKLKNISPGAARTLLYRARLHLKTCLLEED